MEWQRAVKSQDSIFDTFEAHLRVPSIHLFHQVSVYRCARDYLDDLFWNFKYLTPGLFHRPLSADFSKPKKVLRLSRIGYNDFWPINSHKGVKLYSPEEVFFVSENCVCCPNHGCFSDFDHWGGHSIKCPFTP